MSSRSGFASAALQLRHGCALVLDRLKEPSDALDLAETKLHGEWADGSNPAQPGSAWMRRSGGGGQIDGVAEGLQLTDQPALLGVGVVAAGERVGAKVAVADTVV